MIGAELLRFDKKQIYFSYDTETEGLNLLFSRPWQLSWSTYTLDQNIKDNNYFVWWKDLQVSRGAAIITRFNYDNYKAKAKDPAEVLALFEKDYYDPHVNLVGQNLLGYDSMIINVMRRALKMPVRYDDLLGRVYDTIALSKAIKLDLKPDKSSSEAFLAWQYRMLTIRRKGLKTSLGTIAKEYKIETSDDQLHDGLYDVRINREIHRQQVWKLEI